MSPIRVSFRRNFSERTPESGNSSYSASGQLQREVYEMTRGDLHERALRNGSAAAAGRQEPGDSTKQKH